MNISYLFASAQGDVPVKEETLTRPFFSSPLETHPFLTLGDFFQAVENFVLRDGAHDLSGLLTRLWDRAVNPQEIDQILIRYEKYGSLYQMASAEVLSCGHRAKFAVSAALSSMAKTCLAHEFEILKELDHRFQLPFLPEPYFKDVILIEKGEASETFVMILSEWFEGYHEWHFSGDDADEEGIVIWDLEQGYRRGTVRETFETIRQAAKILTLYYDTETFQHIFPWHHGAGDFVVRTGEKGIDVRLVTVRGYDPAVSSDTGGWIDPLTAITLFFLNMTVKMRLDKLEGMGEPVWAPAFILPAVLDGFFEALYLKEAEDDYHAGKIDGLIRLLRSLDEVTLRNRLHSLMLPYRQYDPVDSEIIEKHLEDHARELHEAIQDMPR